MGNGSDAIGHCRARSSIGRLSIGFGVGTVGHGRRAARKQSGTDHVRSAILRTTSAHGSCTVGYGRRSARKQSSIGQQQSVTRRLAIGHRSGTVVHDRRSERSQLGIGQQWSFVEPQAIWYGFGTVSYGRRSARKRSGTDQTQSAIGRATNSAAAMSTRRRSMSRPLASDQSLSSFLSAVDFFDFDFSSAHVAPLVGLCCAMRAPLKHLCPPPFYRREFNCRDVSHTACEVSSRHHHHPSC